MADYYPLIARAVAGLDKNTGENRRALYERARAALVNQLRSVEPALDESDITRERLALEEAIRKVEAEAVEAHAPGRRPRHRSSEPSHVRIEGLRGFRETVAEAEGLGEAAAAAKRVGARGLRGDARRSSRRPPSITSSRPAPEPRHHEPRATAPAKDASQLRPARLRTSAAGAAAQSRTKSRRPIRGRRAPMAALIKLILLLLVLAVSPAAAIGSARRSRRWWRAIAAAAAGAGGEAERGGRARGQPKIADRVGPASGDADARQCAGRRGRAKGRALRRGSERSAGQALCRLGALAHRDGVAGAGARARARGARRRGNPRAAHAHDLVAPPQHRQGAAGEPHHRDHVHAAGRFPRRRHRQRARRADEAGRAGARRAARRPRREGDQRLFPDRPVGGRRRRAAQHRAAQGARLVRHSDRLHQRQARHPGDGEGHARRRAPSTEAFAAWGESSYGRVEHLAEPESRSRGCCVS